MNSGQGCIPATRSAITKGIEGGESVVVVADGIAGMFKTRGEGGGKERSEVAMVAKRMGVARLALKTGASICPIYCFGHTDMFQGVADSYGILESVSRRFQVSIAWFHGRWGTPIPYRVPVTMAVGRPIPVTRNADASKEDVAALHEAVLAATRELYYTHREAYGTTRELVFL